jgi:hypothetical protein
VVSLHGFEFEQFETRVGWQMGIDILQNFAFSILCHGS